MNIFDAYTALYFFSAAFQGNIALLAFSAVFVTYRLQLVSMEKESIASTIASYVTRRYDFV
jgi:hypothetical protein